MSELRPNVYAAICIPVPFSTLALALRLKARRMTRMGMGYDDCFAVGAWVLAVSYAVDLFIWATCFKLGQRLAPLSEGMIDYYMEKSRLVLWTSEFIFAWSIFFSKMAVLYFYRRLFIFSSIRIPIIVLMVACSVWITIRTFFTIFHCIPPRAYWDLNIKDATCVADISDFYLGTNITHCSMDFIILCLPIYEVVRMHLPRGQKIAVIGLFATGSLVGIASIFQITQTRNYDPSVKELPYQLALSMAWGNVEVHLAVFVGSLALLRPIFRPLIPGLNTEKSDTTSGPSRRSSIIPTGWAARRGSCPTVIETPPPSAHALDHHGHRSNSLPLSKGNALVEYENFQLQSFAELEGESSRHSQSSIC